MQMQVKDAGFIENTTANSPKRLAKVMQSGHKRLGIVRNKK